jgi:hypothetical protein
VSETTPGEAEDPLGGPWPLTADAVKEAAEAICPVAHRTRSPLACNDCWANAEAALRAAWPVIARTLGISATP